MSGPFTLLSSPISGDAPSYTEAEANDDFASANAVMMPESGEASLHGSLGSIQDVDVFAMGPAGAGNRMVITVYPPDRQGIEVGVFNAEGELLQLAMQAGRGGVAQYFETVCRVATANVYITVCSPPGGSARGDYTLAVRRSGGAVPAPVPQVLVLDFDGDPAVSIGGGTPVAVPAFDASRISAKFAGQTDVIQQKILEDVRAAFDGLGVTVLASDEPGAEDASRSTIYFGTYNRDLLGLADSVDTYNGDLTQSAIVFTDTFALFSPLNPSVDEIAQVLANVAAHEAGHLLGLWHVRNVSDLMDITASARQMLRPQVFQTSPLHSTVGPIGSQDGAALLSWALGGVLKADTRKQRPMLEADDGRGAIDFEVDRRLLSVGPCGASRPD